MVACMWCSFCGSYRAERSNGRTAAVRPGVTVGEEVLEPRRLQQLEPTRWLHHSCDPAAPSGCGRGGASNLRGNDIVGRGETIVAAFPPAVGVQVDAV